MPGDVVADVVGAFDVVVDEITIIGALVGPGEFSVPMLASLNVSTLV